MSRILIVDDDAAICRSLAIQLRSHDHEVRTCTCGSEALDLLRDVAPDVAFVDLVLPDRDGLSVMKNILERRPDCSVVIITGTQDMQATIQAIRQGAFDYLRKPLSIDDVLLAIEKATSRPVRQVVAIEDRGTQAREIVGRARAILEVTKDIARLSQSRITVLITGETGTGKELAARALHEAGSPSAPFVAVNCSAVVPTLFESELFGHEKGAFTGAEARQVGKLELAGAGTVFFDEIGDMPLDLQAKLLRVLQERELYRVGGAEMLSFDARVIAATGQELSELVEAGRFREDLHYRLSVATVSLPPLRDRPDDIPLLVEHLLPRINRELHQSVTKIPEALVERLMSYDWPGNVRELENVLMRAVALSTGDVLEVDSIQPEPGPDASRTSPQGVQTLREVEQDHVAKVLAATGWNITQTAKLLGISPPTLRKKIQDYSLSRPV